MISNVIIKAVAEMAGSRLAVFKLLNDQQSILFQIILEIYEYLSTESPLYLF